MMKDAESFVVWIERAGPDTGRLGGWVEWTRRSERIGFHSPEELLRFLELCVRDPGRDPGRVSRPREERE